MFSTLYPVNPQRKVGDGNAGGATVSTSLYPGGIEPASGWANFAMVDGSVHFVKDTIASWPIDPATGLPVGMTFGGNPASQRHHAVRYVPGDLQPEPGRGRQRRFLLIRLGSSSTNDPGAVPLHPAGRFVLADPRGLGSSKTSPPHRWGRPSHKRKRARPTAQTPSRGRLTRCPLPAILQTVVRAK